MSRFRRTRAVALRRYDFSETSQVLHLYTRDSGKVHCIAKGAKRGRSAFRGPFDVMVLYDVIRMEKQPGTLDLLTSAEPLRDFKTLRHDYPRFIAASYLCDLVDEFTLEGQPQPDLFDLLESGLEALAGGAPPAPAVFSFETRLLRILGHIPRVDVCGGCRRRLSGPEAYFSARDGGAVCITCRPRDPARFLVKRPVLDAIGAFADGRSVNLAIFPGFVAQLRRVMDHYICFLLEREPKSMRFLRDAVNARPAEVAAP